ncbi:YcnI family copper-binding membrane protein [Streptomyces fructofermentans]|uniref:Membrane protein n=1 Tax=Streptomyces fructofermentans TaxID=152141 RepID=A0A918NLQ1_9ACTN|nr:YcnI family protein [Streptomyces fructofermentans]GGX79123.1 membrane protein [Streptomyces fructofermentans]
MKASRVAVSGVLAATAALALSGPAFAHVSVQPEGTAAKGGYATVNFKVPNERDNASTTKLEVNFPADHPLASVMPQPVAGWTVKVTKSKLDKPLDLHGRKIDEAVTKVTWTADGKGIQPGFFQKFPLSLGALPEDTDELVFKAIQTYSNKEVVRWIETQEKGEEEPEAPAPVLALTAAEEGHHGAAAGSDDADEAEKAEEDHAKDAKAAASTTEASADSSDTTARVLGVVGIVVGVAGVAFGVVAGRRRTTA